jgi:MoaA/NifB/PqqE/SkfB family radical SAM enzyme
LATEHNWGAPAFFFIETINSCNFRCVYCPQSRPEGHFINGRGVMPLRRFEKIVANLRSAFDVRSVALQRDGEPLLNKNIEEYVSHLTGQGIAASFSSNCSLITQERAVRLIESGLRRAKTDFCADPELYERLRAGGRWQRTLDGMRSLLSAAEGHGADFRLNITDLATHDAGPGQVQEAMSRTRSLFERWPDRVTVIPVRFHNALGNSKLDLSGAARVGGRHYCLCHQPWVSMTIDFGGRVVCCCRDLRSEHVLGNLLEQSAADVWNGEPMRRLRRALAQRRPGDVSVCGRCDVPWKGSYSGTSKIAKYVNFFFSKFFLQERGLSGVPGRSGGAPQAPSGPRSPSGTGEM